MAKVPLKWGKVEDSGKVGINVPEDTTFASTDPALKVDGNIEATQLNGVTIGNSPKFTDNNTTYAFTDGTNGFTVTPSGGQAQTINVTPSISNNVTGSGASDCIAKFNGENTITSGPAIGTDTTKYLRNDGTWQVPPNTDTDTKNTAGATNTASKIYLVGAMSQDENPQTYSNGQVYATNGELTSDSLSTGEISASSASISGDIELTGNLNDVNMDYFSTEVLSECVTKKSGSFTITNAIFKKWGMMCQLFITIRTSASIAAGANLDMNFGSVLANYLPSHTVYSTEYDAQRLIGAAIIPADNIVRIRNSNTVVNSGVSIDECFTWIL